MEAPPSSSAINHAEDPEEGRQKPEFQPLMEEEDNNNAPQSIPVAKKTSTGKKSSWKTLLVVAGGLLLVAGWIFASMNESSDASTVNSGALAEEPSTPTTTHYRDPVETAEIKRTIGSFLGGEDYFDPFNTTTEDTFFLKTRQRALEWILQEDPLQLNSTDAQHLLQRFLLALFYLQTARNEYWTECDPSSHVPRSDGMCFYPKEDELYNQMGSPIWGFPWLSGKSECQWAGVKCSKSKSITELRLRYNNLNGPLPWELSKFPDIKVLELYSNSLTGTIPSELGLLGSSLLLTRNQLEGTIPTELFGEGREGVLDLGRNSLTGTVPTEAGSSQRSHILLNDNMLSGSLPPELFQATNLSWLRLSGNPNIIGTLSSQVGQLANLELFWADRTGVTGTIPSQIGQLTKLRYFSLDRTSLSGSIPSEVALLSSLQELLLFNTKLGGNIPEELYAGLSTLQVIDISGCSFSGSISTSLGLWSKLETLRIADNALSGEVPAEIGSLPRLHNVTLNGNNFTTKSVPDALCALRDATPFVGNRWDLVADCLRDASTGDPAMTCPHTCCTRCCDPKTGICQAN